jgi:hypothetical protein
MSFLVWLGSHPPPPWVPLAVSPVANYKAPNAQASWVALGINGYVQQHNDMLEHLNEIIRVGAAAALMLEDPRLTPAERADKQAGVRWSIEHGKEQVLRYNDLVRTSRDPLAAACLSLKVPLPRHGTNLGMQYVLCVGMDAPE